MLLLLLIFALFISACSTKLKPKNTYASITELLIPAPSLEGDLLGDPTEQHVSIYLPPSYKSTPNKRNPVIYLLHGFTGTNRTWLIDPSSINNMPAFDPRDGNYQQAGMVDKEQLDSLIESGVVPELILVAPNGRNKNKHSFYVNSLVTGLWEDYIIKDVVNYIDSNYRTMPVASSRGIAGHSGGGMVLYPWPCAIQMFWLGLCHGSLLFRTDVLFTNFRKC